MPSCVCAAVAPPYPCTHACMPAHVCARVYVCRGGGKQAVHEQNMPANILMSIWRRRWWGAEHRSGAAVAGILQPWSVCTLTQAPAAAGGRCVHKKWVHMCKARLRSCFLSFFPRRLESTSLLPTLEVESYEAGMGRVLLMLEEEGDGDVQGKGVCVDV